MSAIDDLRTLLQDVVTPDLKALNERVTSLEKRLDEKIDGVEKRLDGKIDHTRDLLLTQMKTLKSMMAANQTTLLHALDIDRRMERIESEHAQNRRLAS